MSAHFHTTPDSTVHRVVLKSLPFPDFGAPDVTNPWNPVPQWPARWIRASGSPSTPFVAAYRLDFELARPRRFCAHVSGDERYELFLDGRRVARGPARAPLGWWYFESFDFELPAGKHSLSAWVWSLGKLAPWAQLSFAHGFIFAPEPGDLWERLATGRAAWRSKILPGYTFTAPDEQSGGGMGCGAVFEIEGSIFDWNWLESDGACWHEPVTGADGNSGFTLYIEDNVPWMRPSELPMPLDEPVFPRAAKVLEGDFSPGDFLKLNAGESLTIPSHRLVRAVFDWCDYVAAYPSLELSGGAGAVIRLGWCEAAANEHGAKIDRTGMRRGNSPANDGLLERFMKPCGGMFDTFRPEGGMNRVFEPLWWRCGRFVFLEIETTAEGIVLEALHFRETRFPFEFQATWQTGDAAFERMLALCRRTLELCAHETFMDCPFWEQLQYAGDTRLQALIAYVSTGDDVLARRALRAFDACRRNRSGWPSSSHPSQVLQSIPPFALAWVAMLHDFALWRGDKDFVREIMPAARDSVERWLVHRRRDGLIANPPGWNFLDSADDLVQLRGQVHGAIHWLLVGALRQMSELENWLGENEFASRADRLAHEIAGSAEAFWSDSHGLYADDLEKSCFSEHTNAFAILSGLLPKERTETVSAALFDGPENLTRTQIYATHFLFEAAAECGRMDVFWRRLAPWLDLAGQGYATTPENFGPTRSECHAWGAHPLFHLFASVAGVRPASFGFETIRFRPQTGPLKAATLTMAHPRGKIRITWSGQEAPHLTLPEGVGLAG
jgi:HPt (histidine-containing phosphotransfer) domain-containing protein